MDAQSVKELASQAKGLAKFFEVDICIKIFGIKILEYHFPPKEKGD